MNVSLVLLLAGLSLAAASPQFNPFRLFSGNRGNRGNRGQSQRQPPRFNGGTRNQGGVSRSCGGGFQPNHRFGNKDYLVSWQVGCSSFSHRGGLAFCRQNGMEAISIDSSAKEREFLGLVGRRRGGAKYFWTGGKLNVNSRSRKINWPSLNSYDNVNWSNTGGAGLPQPDNREGNESCVAVLNNFYNDGVRFHDVSCHHKKPVICEAL